MELLGICIRSVCLAHISITFELLLLVGGAHACGMVCYKSWCSCLCITPKPIFITEMWFIDYSYTLVSHQCVQLIICGNAETDTHTYM